MGTAAARNIRRFRGRLTWNPTDLTADFPHGGNELGTIRDSIFRFNIRTAEITAQEWGGIPTERLLLGSSAVFAAILREFDDNAVGTIFPDTPAGSATSKETIRAGVNGSGVTLGGTLLSTLSGVLVVSPHSPQSQEFLILRNAIPLVDEAAELQYSAGDELGIAVQFIAAPDTSHRQWQVGRRRDLSL